MNKAIWKLAAFSTLLGLVACAGGEKESAEDTSSDTVDDTGEQPEDTGEIDADGDGFTVGTDCDDTDAGIHPAAVEVCDGVDNDCDGAIDDAAAIDPDTWYLDADGDTYGDDDITQQACDPPKNHVAVGGDCDDDEAAVNPDATEVCDGIDNDCDVAVDDEDNSLDTSTGTPWYADEDGDGYGDPADEVYACEAPDGWVSGNTDTDDADAVAYPGSDAVDDDGDSYTDEDGDCDDADASVTPVSFLNSEGATNDLTATFAAGTALSPVHHAVTRDGTLRFCPGTWYTALDLQGDVAVIGLDGADLTTLSGGDSTTVITVDGSHTVSLEGLTISGGYHEERGGGLYTFGATLTIAASIFSDNSSGIWGGAGYIHATDATIDETVFTGNASEDGGGLSFLSSTATITDSTFSDNSAEDYGGAIDFSYTNMVMTGVTLDGNTTGVDGGGLDAYNGELTISDSTFSNNSSRTGGGGAVNVSSVELVMEGVTADGNSSQAGGALYISREPATITDSVFSNNRAVSIGPGPGWAANGGALFLSSSGVTLSAVTFDTNNTSGDGGAIYLSSSGTLAVAVSDFIDSAPEDVFHNSSERSYDWGKGASFVCDEDGCE